MPVIPLRPYWSTADNQTVRLYQGDVLGILRRLPTASIHCVCTSPPYWGLRDYGTGTWTGGDPACDHKKRVNKSTAQVVMPGFSRPFRAGDGRADHREEPIGAACVCGAVRIGDRQLGSEQRPDCLGWARGVNCAETDWESGCYICRMVLVFRALRRVLRDDGVLWLDMGDSYGGRGGPPSDKSGLKKDGRREESRLGSLVVNQSNMKQVQSKPPPRGLPSGNLVGVPWRLALALQADGWILRQDVIWHKPAPMPESVQNRCTKAHEYIFLFAKKSGYYCDMEAVKETSSEASIQRPSAGYNLTAQRIVEAPDQVNHLNPNEEITDASCNRLVESGLSNLRSVWTVDDESALGAWLVENAPELLEDFLRQLATRGDVWRLAAQGYAGAHFATFPEALPERCIKAGTSERGCCGKCGAPWVRVVDKTALTRNRPNEYVKRTGADGTGNSCANTVAGVETRTMGWRPNCECQGQLVKHRVRAANNTGADEEESIPRGWAVGEGSHDVRDAATGDGRVSAGEPLARAQAMVAKERWITVVEYVSDLPLEDHPVVPCTVLDPFVGSGTTCKVAVKLGRRAVGIDLSETYLRDHAVPRIEGVLLGKPETAGLVRRAATGPVRLGKTVRNVRPNKLPTG